MATVYKAKDLVLNRCVAIKILRDEFTTDEEFVKRFNIEAQAAASITDPNIVSVYDVGKEENLYFIVMELVKGKTIYEALQVTNKAVMEALDGLPPVKVHCSLLAEEAIHAALWDYAEKHGIKIEGLSKPKSDIHEDEEDEEEY